MATTEKKVVSAKLLQYRAIALDGTDCGLRLLHWCPGCDQPHTIDIEKPNHCGALWQWDGNPDAPTVSPSINYVGQCHYFLRAGQLVFCGDSKHELAGKTVPLPDFDPATARRWGYDL